MVGYTKLHALILDSSIWSTSAETRCVWITMLAMADADGIVSASVTGLARRANVTVENCEAALAAFSGPDPESRDGTTGERIEKVPGGWLLLNHANYRDSQTREQRLTAERVARHRAKDDARRNVTGTDVTLGNAPEVPAASASASASDSGRGAPERPADVSEQVWQDWKEHRRRKKATMNRTAVDTLREKAAAAGMSLEAAMAHCVAQGHQGFFPPDKKNPRHESGQWNAPAPVKPPPSIQHEPGNDACRCDECDRIRLRKRQAQ